MLQRVKKAWSCFYVILHSYTVIQDVSAHQLFNEWLAELSTILDVYTFDSDTLVVH